MRRWHQEEYLMVRRRRLHRSWSRVEDVNYRFKPGHFRKLTPLRCPHSRKKGTGGCKAHKTLGNGRGGKRFNDLKKLYTANEDLRAVNGEG